MNRLSALTLVLLLSGPALCAPDSSVTYNDSAYEASQGPVESSYHLSGGTTQEMLKNSLWNVGTSTDVLAPSYRNNGLLGDIELQKWNYASHPYMLPSEMIPRTGAAYGRHSASAERVWNGATMMPMFGNGLLLRSDGGVSTW